MKNTILIIDRDTVTLKRLRNILSSEGFELMTATNLATAKEIIKRVQIAYILAEPDFCSELRRVSDELTDHFSVKNKS